MSADSSADRVGYTVHQLHTVVSDLWKLRLDNETADLVLHDHDGIVSAFNALAAFVEDVRAARENMKQAAE